MDTAPAFSKCVLSDNCTHAHVICAQCTLLPANHLSSSIPCFYLFAMFESFKSPVTSSVVTINVFLRADEIEMVMTDLERANQVT